MLEINMEFRKGIMFIRLIGELTEKTIATLRKEVTGLIEFIGLRKLVFNLEDVNKIDIHGINALIDNYNVCKKYDGQALLCNIDNSLVKKRIYHSSLFDYMKEANDEISAIKILNLGGT